MESQQRLGLMNSAIIQSQIQGFELSHPSIFPIYELLKNQSHRISMTQDNNKISERSYG